jgi:hypothetical protein
MNRQLAKIIADSISPDGVRLTTMEVVLPRIVLSEFNTHRTKSRSSASSRAIPVEKMIARVVDDPYIPEQWDRNGAGMQGHGLIKGKEAERCVEVWLHARDVAVVHARKLAELGIHKQTTNRLLEPFMWHTIIVTATEWSNFYNLRCNPLAHPALRNTAEAMRAVQAASTPSPVAYGEWHLPYFDPERDADVSPDDRPKICVARCARVSYLTHDGIRDPSKDIELANSLLSNAHMAPLEHVARPMGHGEATDLTAATGAWALTFREGKGIDTRDMARPEKTFAGNFRGWIQYRKTITGEADILAHRSSDAC